MPSPNWIQKSQGLFGKRLVGVERVMAISKGTDEKTLVNALIMDIFNLFNSCKLTFEKRNMPPLTIDYRFSDKNVLFVYSIADQANPDPFNTIFLMALAQRAKKNGPLDGILLVLAPGRQATSAHGGNIADLLDQIRSPYSPGIFQPQVQVTPPTEVPAEKPSNENI
jgi:hypothetical protein